MKAFIFTTLAALSLLFSGTLLIDLFGLHATGIAAIVAGVFLGIPGNLVTVNLTRK